MLHKKTLKPTAAATALDNVKVQARCLSALMTRDMMKRFGRANIGFLWIIIEPLILTVSVMVLWSFTQSADQHGIGILTLVLTGYMPLTLWRHITQSGVFAFRSSAGLLYHRHISLIDILLARFLLEFVGTTAALSAVYMVLALVGAVETLKDPGIAMLGWVSLGILSLGTAVNFAVLTEKFELAERFISPFQYIMLPLSGSFFMVEWLPKSAQDIAIYMPTVHCYEMFRAGFLNDAVVTHYTPWYPAVFGLVLLYFGLNRIESVRDDLRS